MCGYLLFSIDKVSFTEYIKELDQDEKDLLHQHQALPIQKQPIKIKQEPIKVSFFIHWEKKKRFHVVLNLPNTKAA